MKEETRYQLALTLVPQIGTINAKILLEKFGTAQDIFRTDKKTLSAIEGMSSLKANNIKDFENWEKVDAEVEFCLKHNIQILCLQDAEYPQRLKHCNDAPILFFLKGNYQFNQQKLISIVGTRSNSEYGKQITEQIITELKNENIAIVSGLAYGIDAIAHKTALHNNIPTLGVLGHGLKKIYPPLHQSLAYEMIENGGLVTEFISTTNADKHNFPQRNRIVAGLSDTTIIIETDQKGGSMITANLAYAYNRDVFAIPGRINESKSRGCNELIFQQKAQIFIAVPQFLEELGWKKTTQKKAIQPKLFVDLSPEETKFLSLFKEKNILNIDEIILNSNQSDSIVAALLLELEFKGLIKSLPGKRYEYLQ